MTVLAYFEDLAIAVSDVLLSVKAPGRGIRIPTIGGTAVANADPPVRPTRLVRKFFTVKRPRSAGTFLVCGTVAHITRVTQNVDGLVTGRIRPPEHLLRMFVPQSAASLVDVAARMTEEEGLDDFELLGAVDGEGYRRHFNRSVPRDLPYWGRVMVMGSGGPDLVDWLTAKGRAFEDAGLGADDLGRKRSRVVNTVPSMLLEEDTRSTMKTLNKGVGGYYECFDVCDTELVPFDRAITIFGRLKRASGRTTFELRRVFFHTYDEGNLIVGTLTDLPMDISPSEPLRVPSDSLEVFHVPPLGMRARPTWNASRLASLMNSPRSMCLTTYRGPFDNSVQRFYEGESGRRLLVIKPSGEFLQMRIDESVLEYYLSRSDKTVPLD